MKILYPTFRILILALFMTSFAFAHNAKNLAIDNDSKTLVASEACSYQWFKNGALLEGKTEKQLGNIESGHYAVEITDEVGAITRQEETVAVTATGAIIKIYLIGDSTVMTYQTTDYPQTGWGQVLQPFFNSANIAIDNRAIGGRSSRTFFQEGRWTPIKTALVAGDYVFMQFGHNDQAVDYPDRYTTIADYKMYLTMYCNDTKAKGGIPVLVSPMVRNYWSGTTMRNVFTESGSDYRGAMLEVATALNVAFIDLNMKSWNLYKTYGVGYTTRFLFKSFLPGEYPNYPEGNGDGTHFQEMGSIGHCRMITEGIKELSARADMANLISNLKPLYSIGISVNPASGSDSMTTKTATYPLGVTVTLKTIPKKGKTFQKWNNVNNTQVSTATLTSVPSGSSATSYTCLYSGAIVTDCNNTVNGTAKLDNCGRCISGTTGKTACASVGEAETEACAFDGITETKNAGFNGTSYLNVDNAVGTAITLNISATNAGTATLSFRYANGGTVDRPAQINLNGTVLPNNLSFPVTGTFTDWKAVDLTLTLLKGNNVLKVISSTAEGLPNIDQIGYVSAGVSKGSCVITALDVELGTLNYQVYPNPSKTSFHVNVSKAADLQVIDINGKLCEEHKNVLNTEFGENLKSGIYFLKIENKVFKLVKE